MPEYTLTYFNVRGRAELIRLIFHVSGTKFVDKRIEGKDWPALKPNCPQETLPLLAVDGKQFCQSTAIARYIANQTDLTGKDALEKLATDGIVDLTSDYLQDMFKSLFEKDETKKAELTKKLKEETTPKFFRIVKKQLADNPGDFLVGKSLTWADLAVFHILDTLMRTDPNMLDQVPELKAYKKRVEEIPKLSVYLKSRPVTEN